MPWFQERGLWQDNSYEPRPGDIIFFDWDDGGQDGSSDHVGIVEKVENGRIYTIEGNSAIAAVKTVTRLVTMKSMGTEPRRIN